jgi:nucleoside-diphosphate-sugar epimerase
VTVLVTGASGFVGLALTKALVLRGEHVRTLNRGASADLDALAREGSITITRGDLVDRDVVLRAAEGARAILHVGAKAGVWGPYADYFAANVVGTENVLAAVRAHAIGKLVYTSTPSVVHSGGDVAGLDESAPYATHFSTAYPETKAIAERTVLRANGETLSSEVTLATCALRPHLVWGPGDTNLTPRIVDRARRGRLALVDGGRSIIDATYIDSCVHAHLLALDRLAPGAACAGKAYFIAQGEKTSVRDLVMGIVHAHGLSPTPRSVPLRVAKLIGGALEAGYRLARSETEPPLTRFVAEQLGTSHWFDLSAAKRDLGYEAPVTTKEGLARLAASARRSFEQR